MPKNRISFIRFCKVVINLIYPLFKPVMTERVYHFCATGGICFGINVAVFYLAIHLLPASGITLNSYLLPAHIAAWLMSQAVSIPIGFYLNYYIVFPESTLKTSTQFFRFIFTNIFNVVASYLLIRFLVEVWQWNPIVSLIAAMLIATVINYIVQLKFAFQKK